jgi:hypothetical protein
LISVNYNKLMISAAITFKKKYREIIINYLYVVYLPFQTHYYWRYGSWEVLSTAIVHRQTFQTEAWSNDRSRIWCQDDRNRRKKYQAVDLGHSWARVIPFNHTLLLPVSSRCHYCLRYNQVFELHYNSTDEILFRM